MAIGHYHHEMDKKPQDTESRHADKYVLRFPEGMRTRIAEAAKENSRSMNAEIISRLQQSYEPSGDTSLLQQLADERRNTAKALGSLCTTLAKMLLAAVRLFTPEQKKKAPEIGVWNAIAEGVVQGRGEAIVEMFEKMNSSDAHGPLDGPAKSARPGK